MPPNPEDNLLCPEALEDLRPIREVLERVAYSEGSIREVLGVKEIPPASARSQLLPLWLWRTRGGAPLDCLLRLFLLREPVTPEEFTRAVEPTGPQEWARLGLVRLTAASVTARVQLVPHGGLVLAADWPGPPEAMRQHVMAPSGSSRTLADFTIRRPARRTLDLGTGCGLQALLAATHSDRVRAVDCNPRAVNFAAFNARVNGLGNVHCQTGDLFEPVRGQQFDLVVGNLPFVICPEDRYLYCQGGRPGDRLCWDVVRAVPSLLREGGCCQLVSDLTHVTGEDFAQRLAGWFEGTGCDAWVFYSLTLDVAAYAAQWLRETEGSDLRRSAGQFDAWMTYYERERIEAVSFGLIALRRRSSSHNWFRCEEVPGSQTPGGDAVALGFALRDFLETVRDDEAMLEARLRGSPDLRWQQDLEPSGEGWAVTGSRLQSAGAWVGSEKADATTLFIMARCQGEARVRDILAELVAASGQGSESVIAFGLSLVRRLLELGLLLPVVGGPA